MEKVMESGKNPFKEMTSIKFSADKESLVSLKVFKINGSLVNIVFDNKKIAEGEQIIAWSAQDLPAGLYILNLTINGESFNRRFLIEE